MSHGEHSAGVRGTDQRHDSCCVKMWHAAIGGANTIQDDLQVVGPLVATRRDERVSDLDGRNRGDFADGCDIGLCTVSSWSGRWKAR